MTLLVSRSEFARRCGVSPAAVTKAIKSGKISAAVSGKYIDADHSDAVAYYDGRGAPAVATGLDDLHEDAVAACRTAGRVSVPVIQRACHVGYNRAARLRDAINALGVDLAPVASVVPPVTRKVRPTGRKAARESRKSEAPPGADSEPIPNNIMPYADMSIRDLVAKFGTDYRFVDWLNAVQKIEAIEEKRLRNAREKGELVSRDLVKVAVLENIDTLFKQLLTDGAKTIAQRAHTEVNAGHDVGEIEHMVNDLLASFIKPTKAKIKRDFDVVD